MQAREQRAQPLAGTPPEADLVVVADDAIRLRRLLTVLDHGRACTIDRLLDTANVEVPDVAVISCRVVREGVEALARLRVLPSLRVVLVVPAATGPQIREAFASGADGLVLEQALESSLPTAVEAVLSDQLVLPRASRGYLVPVALSRRDKQVLGLVVLGFSNRAIAAKLHVTEATVKSHVNASFRKLAVRSRAEATARILDPGNGLGPGILSIAGADVSLDVVGIA